MRAAILAARASARLENRPAPTMAEVLSILRPGGFHGRSAEQRKESAERTVRDERAALDRHAPPHPSDPFAGFFDLPFTMDADVKEWEARVARNRENKRTKAAEKRNRPPGKR